MKWEYRVVLFSGRYQEDDMQVELASLGAQGWELVAVNQNAMTYCWLAHLKRPLDETARGDQPRQQ